MGQGNLPFSFLGDNEMPSFFKTITYLMSALLAFGFALFAFGMALVSTFGAGHVWILWLAAALAFGNDGCDSLKKLLMNLSR